MLRKRILIMAGGTGGHVYPALAVALQLRGQGIEVKWLGTAGGLEHQLVPKQGFELMTIDIGGLRGKGRLQLLFAPLRLCRALVQALRVLRRFRPDAVLGMGGYASGPGGIATWLMRIPLYIHEQNAIAGMTNRLLAPFAHLILEGLPGAFRGNERALTIGNPVREEILALNNIAGNDRGEQDPFRLLVLGGSQGAKALNDSVPPALALLREDIQIMVWHQTGNRHHQQTEKLYADTANTEARVDAYIDDMAGAYAWADLVLCRAGALTLAELCVAGLASILVPFPYAVDDHQTANARVLSERGAAVLLPESELQAGVLSSLLESFYSTPSRLKDMAKKAGELARPDATSRVAAICLGVSHA